MILNISDVEICIKENAGLSLSGGADSAILAYILLKYSKNKIHFFTTASLQKEIITVKHSSIVLKKCAELTNNFNFEHHISYVREQNRDEFFKNLLSKVENNIVDIVYTATTEIPPVDEAMRFTEKLPIDILMRRNPKIIKPILTHKGKLYHPLININKKKIKDLYIRENVLDELFPLTRSCESEVEYSKHCGNCWWCQERHWAFDKLE